MFSSLPLLSRSRIQSDALTLFFARLFFFHLFSVFFSLISFVRFFPLFCPSMQEYRVRTFVLITYCFVHLCTVQRGHRPGKRARTNCACQHHFLCAIQRGAIRLNKKRSIFSRIICVCAQQRTAHGEFGQCSHHFSSFNYTVCLRKPKLLCFFFLLFELRHSKHT